MENYEIYKKEFMESLRADSAISGSDTEDEFLSRALDMLCGYDEIQDPQRLGFGDKRCSGNRVMRADGYCFDETDHSLVLFISDFEDLMETSRLTMTRVDDLYWKMYYFLDEVCNGKIADYFDESDDVLKVARLIRRRMNAGMDDPEQILKIKLFIITNKELSTDLLTRIYWKQNYARQKAGNL